MKSEKYLISWTIVHETTTRSMRTIVVHGQLSMKVTRPDFRYFKIELHQADLNELVFYKILKNTVFELVKFNYQMCQKENLKNYIRGLP